MNTATYSLSLEPHPQHPRARVRILTGLDDGHPFRVQVPLRCRSVEEAVVWLRPAGVPEGAPRQGELFFVPMGAGFRPSSLAGESMTQAGSEHVTQDVAGPSGFGEHVIEHGELPGDRAISRMVQSHGRTAFIGRRRVRFHGWTGRPRYFARGAVVHPQHGTLALGVEWHEVLRNRAFGPWPVGGLWGGD